MIPWPWVEAEHLAELDLRTLSDPELDNLSEYRAVVAVSTIPGHIDHERTTDRLTAVWAEQSRRRGD